MHGSVWAKLFILDLGAWWIFFAGLLTLHVIRVQEVRTDEPLTVGGTVIVLGFFLTSMVLVGYIVTNIVLWTLGV